MLSKNSLVRFRSAIEKLYDATCNIVVNEEYEKPNGVTAFRDVAKYTDEPCHVSQTTANKAENDHVASEITKRVSIYLKENLNVPAGSKILVTYNGITTEYKFSGESARYDCFQKIVAEHVGRWA